MTRVSRKRPSERRYRGRSTVELRAERRQRLVDSAVRLIGADGYPALTIERLCAHARVSPRHFYEHFRNREEVLHALFDHISEDMRAVVAEALRATDGDPVDRALGAVSAFVTHALADPDLARIAFIETVGVSKDMERRRREAMDNFVAVIRLAAEHLAARGVLPQRHFRLSAVALVGATNELLVEWLNGDTGLSAEQMARAIPDLFHTLIAGARATART